MNLHDNSIFEYKQEHLFFVIIFLIKRTDVDLNYSDG